MDKAVLRIWCAVCVCTVQVPVAWGAMVTIVLHPAGSVPPLDRLIFQYRIFLPVHRFVLNAVSGWAVLLSGWVFAHLVCV